MLAAGSCNEVAFTNGQGVDLLSLAIGPEDVLFHSFSAVMSFGVSEVTRLVFFVPCV